LKFLNQLPWSIEIIEYTSMVHGNCWICFRGPLKLLDLLPWSIEIVESASVVRWICCMVSLRQQKPNFSEAENFKWLFQLS
jgi:hypothetical protein